MLTQNEINALNLSPTKKDFVQIWNELLEVAGKLSERWDPTSTNESDPGIVILKALTGIADKLNYNIDKNTLEAFMPTAAQEDSMRKLCDMLGYNIKYYRSAETEVTIKYRNTDPSDEEEAAMKSGKLYLPKFTVITNADQDISYFTTNEADIYIHANDTSKTVTCMEGQIVKCEGAADNNVITANQISEDNKFYLPEAYVAENGIFVYNVFDGSTLGLTGSALMDGTKWAKVDNLNVQERGSRVYKFGYDSYASRPYIEFPADYSELFNDGIFIYYTRTSGASGNVSADTLTKIELPSSGEWSNVSAESFTVTNTFAATTGANIETIKQAYGNFKKTIGTFETLVTCRDYMNKIYLMLDNGKPIVSNILVTDIRSDLNRAVTICSCDDAGIFYKETPIITGSVISETTEYGKAKTDSEQLSEPEPYGEPKFSDYVQDGDPVKKITSVVSEANKPFYSETPATITFGDITRTTNWFIPAGGGGRIALYADEYSREWNSAKAFGKYFDCSKPGDVSEYEADGKTISTVWQITQYIDDDSTFRFKTNLPITLVEATDTTIRETRTEIINNIQTKTVTKVQENTVTQVATEEKAIDHFDLVLYPFKSYTQIKNNVKDIRKVYDASFNYSPSTFKQIETRLNTDSYKTIAHNFKQPRENDVISINNYLRLNATIATNSKITAEEGAIIIDKIKIALANAFNMRELDFGEEIPFDSIVEVIENADSRIRIASVNEPALYTTFSVYGGNDITGAPIIKEYAVESDWLTLEEAKTVKQLDTTSVDENGAYRGTFDTEEAREIYNKLVVRNVLAGRVPLFKYNNTFKTSFSEGPYQVTAEINHDIPEKLAEPTKDNPFTVCVVGDKTYTGRWTDDGSEEGKCTYQVTETPESYKNSVITSVGDEAITDIVTHCEIYPEASNVISDVTLNAGEFIKFRAPNFTTSKTYPAYVNYHLQLDRTLNSEAKPAVASTLFDLLSADGGKWQEVFDHFSGTTFKQTIPLKQVISKYAASNESNADKVAGLKNGTIVLDIPEYTSTDWASELHALIEKSGCIKLANPGMKATVKWEPADGETAPAGDPDLDFVLSLNSPFISDVTTVSDIAEAINNTLSYLVANQGADGIPSLPTECAWSISLDFEAVPFEAASLNEWKTFVKSANFGFTPAVDGDTILWRAFGEGYQIGKNIMQNTAKLLPFTSNYFGTLPASRLRGIYVVTDLGSDEKPVLIANNEEYKLREGERLFIEYTPSVTNEDGTTANAPAKTEVHGTGTIIKPTGFEVGLIDSTIYGKDHGITKQVTFDVDGKTEPVDLFSFGANEQVEIREFANVVLSKASFKGDSTGIYYYKNFNGCDELEKLAGKDGNRSYTLKDGEYIFYTDQNKTELAYFTTGTEVTLTGNITLSKFEVIDISTIFESGLSEIPWQYYNLATGDTITFQEYQYITLGEGDTLTELTLLTNSACLNDTWQPCDLVEYRVAGAENTSTLPSINLSDDKAKGNGWQACSTLELDVSDGNAQILRSTDKVKTSIELLGTSSSGGGQTDKKLTIKAEAAQYPIAFKTNLKCQTSSNKININDIYTNTENLPGFEFKVFAVNDPAFVKTATDKLIPYTIEKVEDFASWADEPLTTSTTTNSWHTLDLKDIRANQEDKENTTYYDRAVKLSTAILPNTYGVFSIYVNYTDADNTDIEAKTADTGTKAENATEPAKVWLEVLPGTSHEDITLFNVPEEKISWEANKLFLRAGLNCIRVNKSHQVFIKASKLAQGTLSFDELKLVDCTPLKYRDPAKGEFISEVTQGLNIEQLGYLNTNKSTEDATVLDRAMRYDRKQLYTNEAKAKLQKATDAAESEFKMLYAKLKDNLDSLLVMHTFTTEAADEIKNLAETYPESLTETLSDNTKKTKLEILFKQHAELWAELKREEALLKALDDNKNIEELEKQLVALLDSITTTEQAQQQLIADLDALKAQVLAGIDEKFVNIPDLDVLNDFEKSVSAMSTDADKLTLAEDLAEELEIARKEKVEELYNKQLAEVTLSLSAVANFADRAKLIEALTALQMTDKAEKYAALQAKIDNLIDDLDHTQINDYLDTASTQLMQSTAPEAADDAKAQAKIQAASVLTSLYSYLNTISSRLTALQNELDILDGSTTEKSAESKRIATTLSVYSDTLTMLASNSATDNLPTDGLKAIRGNINSCFNSLAALGDLLESKIEAFSGNIDAIQEVQTEQAEQILARLNAIADERTAQLTPGFTVDNLVNDEKHPWPERGAEAILAVWPAHMREALQDEVETWYNTVYGCILDHDDSAHQPPESSRLNENTQELFKAIFYNAKSLAKAKTQAEADIALINKIGSNMPISKAISDAKVRITDSAMESDPANRVAVLRELLGSLEDNIDLKEKQNLVASLRSELANAIKMDRKLVSISAKLLCPRILIFEEYLPVDTVVDDTEGFYDNLVNYLTDLRNELLDLDSISYNYITQLLFGSITDVKPDTIHIVDTSVPHDIIYLESEEERPADKITVLAEISSGELNLHDPAVETLIDALVHGEVEEFKAWLVNVNLEELKKGSILPTVYIDNMNEVKPNITLQNDLIAARNSRLMKLLDETYAIYEVDDGVSNWVDHLGQKLPDEKVKNGNPIDRSGRVIKLRKVNDEWRYYYDESDSSSYIKAAVVKMPDDETDTAKAEWYAAIDSDRLIGFSDNNSKAKEILVSLLDDLQLLANNPTVSEDFRAAYSRKEVEKQLLDKIRELDANNDFYYTAPIDSNLAIELNESIAELNTLMNPATNYDVNNINNNFVISKLDIDYLDRGLQIARSSRLS